MHTATNSTATVASKYASHTPFPASAQTSGIVAAGVVVGAIVETDCASVSIGESTPRRKPYPAACESVSAIQDFSGAPLRGAGFSMPYDTGLANVAQQIHLHRSRHFAGSRSGRRREMRRI
jgi:hypothetical protein